jgi:hypothetical protein
VGLSNYLPSSRISQPGVCTSSTRPTSPYEGQVIYETDTDRVLVWSGAAWVGIGKIDSLTVSATGIVQTPNQPRFLATRSSDYSYNPAAQTTPVIMNSTTYNVGGHYSTSTGLFTAPVSGTYIFQAGVYQSGLVSQLWWVINGARERSFALDNTNSANVSGSGFLYLNANDTVGFVSWSGGSSVTVYSNSFHTYFRGSLIG